MNSASLLEARQFVQQIEAAELEQAAYRKAIDQLKLSISKLVNDSATNKEALDIATHAIDLLRQVSDEAVTTSYKFIEESLNSALAKMFVHTVRKIQLHEYTRGNQYPQLEFDLIVANGKKRSLKADSGHGLAQIVSILSILALIVLTDGRRLLVMDEIASGLSEHNRKILSDILWNFTAIGFQFVVNEHGFVPKGAKVYQLQMINDVSRVVEAYVEKNGVYLTAEDETESGSASKSKVLQTSSDVISI